MDVPLQAQTKDHHLQTRMARKLPNGNYLVPQLLDKVVREYDAKGKVVWEVKTPDMPFTAIRLKNGNTLISCTWGNLAIEVDPTGKTVWRHHQRRPARQADQRCLRLPATAERQHGLHQLPGRARIKIKLLEVTRDKKIVWTHTSAVKAGIHHFQILDTNGKPLDNASMR